MRAIGVGLCRTCVMETRKPSKHSSLASMIFGVGGTLEEARARPTVPLRPFAGGPVSIADKNACQNS